MSSLALPDDKVADPLGPREEIFPMGTLYCGDCLEIMETRIEPESVDLIYADPPFFTNKKYEVIWKDAGEIRSFEDRWKGGIEVYAQWMAERLQACHRVLKPTGSLYLHCDWHAGHYLKVQLDKIFGWSNFCNEIIWSYAKWSTGKTVYQRNHDTIFFYQKSDKPGRVFNQQFMPRAASTLKRFGKSKITSGHDADGNRVPSTTTDEQSKGVLLDDVWRISRVAPVKQLYPTEKPGALLTRIIQVSSKPGDLVLDPFCGCGTSVVAAEALGRRWAGIDISPTAVKVIRRRLGREEGSAAVEMLNLPTTLVELRKLKPFEFQNWVVRDKFNGTIGPRGGDKGIDGLTWLLHEPIQVKQSDDVGRNVVDNFSAAIRRQGKTTGYIIAFSFGKGAIEEAAALKNRPDGLTVHLVTVADLVRGLKVPGGGKAT